MASPQSPDELVRAEWLGQLLLEQGATPEERAELLPALLRLSEWQAPEPDTAETRRLLARLARMLPAPSPVRKAIRDQREKDGLFLLRIALTQVSLFGMGF